MRRGRPSLGPDLADSLAGSSMAKDRLKVVLEAIAGRRTVQEACAHLGIGEAAFHKLRARALQSALETLEPGRPGRPAIGQTEEDAQLAALQQQVQDLRMQLRAAQVREEIALTMPHLLKVPEDGAKKGGIKQGDRGKKRRR